MSREAMKQALKALQNVYLGQRDEAHYKAITALRQALEQPADEPVAWCIWFCGGPAGFFDKQDEAIEEFERRSQEYPDEDRKVIPLYTRPQPAAQEQQLNALRNEAWHSGVCPVCNSKDEARPPKRKPLTNEQIGKAARDAHIAFCLNKHQTYEHALTRAIEAAHGITGEQA